MHSIVGHVSIDRLFAKTEQEYVDWPTYLKIFWTGWSNHERKTDKNTTHQQESGVYIQTEYGHYYHNSQRIKCNVDDSLILIQELEMTYNWLVPVM